MRRIVPIALAWILASCGPSASQTSVRLAVQAVQVSDDLVRILTQAYQAEGLAAIAHAESLQGAQADLMIVRARWRPIFGMEADGSPCLGTGFARSVPCHGGALQALKAVEDGLDAAIDALSSGPAMTLSETVEFLRQLRIAYCAVRAAVPAGIHLPDAPSFLSCEGGH